MLEKLRERLCELDKRIAELSEMEELTEELRAEFDKGLAEVATIRADIERLEKADEFRAWGKQKNTDNAPPPEKIGGQDNIKVGETREAKKPWNHLAEKCNAIIEAARGMSMDIRLEKEVRAAQGANVGLGSAGGFLVGTERIDIMKKVYEGADLLSYVDQRTIGAGFDSAEWVTVKEDSRANTHRHGGVIGYYIGEADTIDFTNPKFEDGSLKLTEIDCIVPATDRMLRDGVGFESYVEKEVSKEFIFQANRGIISGTGGGMPLGVMNSASAKSIAKETAQPADTIVFQNILKMRSFILPASLKSNGLVWLYHTECFPQLAQMTMVVGTGGVPVWMPANGIAGKPFDTLFGYPAFPTEFLPVVGDAKDIMLVDLEEYLWISKGGIKADVSIHVYFTTNQTLLRFVWAVNGMPKHNSAKTLFVGSETVSPYLYIAERT